ncbi:MAG TPA: metallophosphoesterase family protein [Vicinamibacterales bacterium]|jgi:diadenosine tetraphosphatase ApaH/serine/threonine PP2A family protein phosphatase|nr:metallophosphoesterase family protein [Vicinamibacterales bacterium]
MRYLVLSDVHANLEALSAVIAASSGEWDQVLVLGDLVGYGADPNAVIERVRALPVAAMVRGNHDKVAAGLASVDSFNHVARQAIEWTTASLTPANLAWLAALPQGPLSIDALTEICHGAPWDEDAYVFDERDVERARPPLSRPLCLFGHTHVPSIFRIEPAVEAMLPVRGERCRVPIDGVSRFLVNCGAVGQPRDNDPRAAFGLLDSEARAVTIVRTTYDVSTAQKKILNAGLPAVLAQRLAVGR